jgi:glucokinase
MSYILGIDMGGTNIKAVAITADAQVLRQDQFETADDPAPAWPRRISDHIRAVEKELGRAVAVGVVAPGLAARDERSIAWMQGRLASVQGFDWTAHLARGQFVPVLNDAHAALLGEAWCGAAAGARDAVMLTLGTGVGGAILCDGRLLRGRLGRAGHLGHISLDVDGKPDIVNTPGSLELAVGDCTVSERSGGRFTSTEGLVSAVVEGDEVARRVWLRSIRALACGIVSIINAVDPQVILLAGGISRAGEHLLAPLRVELDRLEWRPFGTCVRIELAKLGQWAGAIGAARRAMLWEQGAS